MPFKDFQNVHEMLARTIELFPEKTAYRWLLGNTPVSVNWEEFDSQVRKVGKSLMALGIEKDDKVSILSYSSYRWVLSDFGINGIGAVTVGIYQSNLANECLHIIDHSDSVLVFAENQTQLEKLLQIRKDIPDVKKIVLFEGVPEKDSGDWIIRFDQFLELGKGISDDEFQARTVAVTPHDPACIVYTSGTTGIPKGAVLTHDNLTFTAQSVIKSCELHEGDETFLFLPLAHVFARTCVYAAAIAGNTTVFNRGMETLAEDLKNARPHWMASVPRIFEKIQAKILTDVNSKGPLVRGIFQWSLKVGYQVSNYQLVKYPLPLVTHLSYQLAELLVFKKVREAFGGRIRWIGSGAAPLNPELARFFHATGILILEGFGMSENTSFTNVNRMDNYRFGWVGPPPEGVEQKIADDGEVMFRGRNVMKEYYKMPEETADTITSDGWQKTGDLGEIDEKNFLKITGRKKDLIITAGGKNIPPSKVEAAMTVSPFINQACVVGDGRKYLAALITLDPETVTAYASEKGIEFTDFETLAEHPEITRLIWSEIDKTNRNFASYETIKKFAIVPEFTINEGLVTPTLKLKKNRVIERYSEIIETLFPD